MKDQESLVKELVQLGPLIGSWTIHGSFKDNAHKTVDGWEVYQVANNGSTIVCDTEIRTLISGKVVDEYKHTMNIVFDKKENKIMADNEWTFSMYDGTLIIENNRHCYTGKIDEPKETITGKWENKDKSGKRINWYDKVLTRTQNV